MPLIFEKPTGTRDVLPEKLERIRRISADIKELFKKWGYEEIETPLIEYYQTVGILSKIRDERLIKFLDPRGQTIILRPDFTTPIARLVASTFKDADYPVRLMYQGKVYRNAGSKGAVEINQIGMELIGLSSLEGDAEIINLLVQAILKSTQAKFKVAVGHTKFLTLLLSQVGCEPLLQERMFQSLLENDYVTYKNLVNQLQIKDSFKDFLLRILKMRGSFENIGEGQNWFDSLEWQGIFRELSNLWTILRQYQVTDYVSLDLSLVGRQNYYTGMIYHVYCEGQPYPVCSGGRYDNLLASFGRPGPATGFAINIDDLLAVIKNGGFNNLANKTLLLYSQEQRPKAIEKANNLRTLGQRVVMALKGTVTQNYLKGFDKIVNLED